MDHHTDRHISAASVVMQALYQTFGEDEPEGEVLNDQSVDAQTCSG